MGPTIGKLIEKGAGTERVSAELKQLFPTARIGRLDRDTVSKGSDYERILDDVRQGRSDILVGTQMIAKGHDLPGVTAVAIVDCDTGLHFPDFRASEKTFQLLIQAAGRAGRGNKAGTVIFQTRLPEHIAIKTAQELNYRAFASHELAIRKQLNYPPFCKLVRIIAAGRESTTAASFLEKLKCELEKLHPQDSQPVTILGPAPCPIEKIKTKWRWHLLLKSPSHKELREYIALVRESKPPRDKLSIAVDIDPQDML